MLHEMVSKSHCYIYENHSLKNGLEQGEIRNRETSLEAIVVIQGRDYDGLKSGSGTGDGEK